MRTFRGDAPTITFDPAKIAGLLNAEQRRIFDDHLPYDCLHAVVSHGMECCYLVAKRRVHPSAWLRRVAPIAYSELLYCSPPHLLARYLEHIKLALMRKQRTAGLVADDRLFPTPLPRGIAIDDQAFYRSPLIVANELDQLYSELVLLPV
jgi:acetoacetyl-CoA synthetase